MILVVVVLVALVTALAVALLLLYYYARGLELTAADLRKDAEPPTVSTVEIASLRNQLACMRRQYNEVNERYGALCGVMAELDGLRPQLDARLAAATLNARTEHALRNFMIVTAGSTTANSISTKEAAQEATKGADEEGGDSVSLIMRKVRRSNVRARQ